MINIMTINDNNDHHDSAIRTKTTGNDRTLTDTHHLSHMEACDILFEGTQGTETYQSHLKRYMFLLYKKI